MNLEPARSSPSYVFNPSLWLLGLIKSHNCLRFHIMWAHFLTLCEAQQHLPPTRWEVMTLTVEEGPDHGVTLDGAKSRAMATPLKPMVFFPIESIRLMCYIFVHNMLLFTTKACFRSLSDEIGWDKIANLTGVTRQNTITPAVILLPSLNALESGSRDE